MKRALLYLGMAFVLVALVSAPAFALEAKLSGQVNQMVMWADDGEDDDFFVSDNDSSSTRIRFTGEETFGKVKAGVQVEIEAQRNASNHLEMDQDDDGGAGTNGFEWNDRWLNVYFDTQMGKFEIGKGDGAANNTSEQDLSGTSVITYSDVNATAGSFLWVFDGVRSGVEISDTRDNFDGLSRNERLRYNTPNFGGFYAAGSVTNGEAWEVAGFYAAEFYGKLVAAIGYVDSGDLTVSGNTDFTQISGSVSWLLPMGLNFTAAAGQRDYDDSDIEDPMNYYLKAGYKWNIHALSVEYGVTEDFIEDIDSSHYGAAYVINPWKPVEFYAAYRNYMADVDIAGLGDPDDIQQVMAGTRIKF